MSTEQKVALERAIQLLTESCSSSQNQVTQLESRIEQINDKFVRTTAILEELIAKLGNLDERRNGKEGGPSNTQEIDKKDNDLLTRSQSMDEDIHQPHYVKNVSPMIQKAVVTPLSSCAMIIPPSCSIPTFSGKHSERSKQFVVRIQEYAETVHGWDRSTLLTGISQFLRDTALDWYCHLKVSGRQPQTWTEFVELFLSQFNSSICSAYQEQEWYECKQREDETINEFVIRLRALWTEQKPKETEVDLVRHLFYKMRNDLLNIIGAPRGATLDEIIMEAQKVEEVLYRRKNEERRLQYLNQTSSQKDTLNVGKSQNKVINEYAKPLLDMNAKYSSNNKTVPVQRATFNKKNRDRSFPTTNYYKQTTAEIGNIQQLESMKCYNCGMGGDVARNCPTGASLTLINKKLFTKLPYYFRRRARYPPSWLTLQLADKSQLKVQYVLSLPITIENCTKTHTVYVVPKLSQSCIIADDRLQIPSTRLAYIHVRRNKPFSVINQEGDDYEVTSLKNTPCVTNGIINPQRDLELEVANFTERTIMIHPGQALAYMNIKTTERNLAETDLNDIQKQKLSDLIQAFPDVFNEKTGQTSKVKHVIRLLPGSQPCNLPSYRIAPARRQIVEENLREMLQGNVIVSSKSPWASPVILAPKKDGTLRFCIDYRKLNAMTICDAYPIPRIDDTLDSLQEAKFISTLDLRTGYWQVEMDEKSREKTAFITHKGLFEFKVMPYGLTNAPTTFQRLMDIVLAGLKWQCCLVYIDDVIIYSPTFEQHIEDLKRVFEALRSANLTLKTFKCHFCRRETKYLAYIITSDCVKPDPDLVKSVVNFPRPRTIRDVQSFLGLTGYYHRFIQNYARIAEPLIRQLRFTVTGNHHLRWSNECTEAFNTLKKKLTTAPIMNTPNFEQPFILVVDAFEYGLGAILTQEYDDKKYVIAYASRTLSAIERRYGATEREAPTIMWATKHFRVYIERSKILIRSDCKALQWLRNTKDVTGRLAR
ncbi:unnamed protein product [Rotaria sordida]|uniref:Uncharacterized protein n=1 Tax=Rotaria sordida TaxID=392033 RepID=A0A813YQJ6_9BILA|nr:unnamed protein product [Rotaria sordida]